MPTRTGKLKAREFVFYCEDLALAALPPEFPRPERKVMWTTLQLHYGNPVAHFELQPQVGRGLVELGLHFEGPAEANEAWAQRISTDAGEVMAALGEGWELEEWTASWRRLHRTFPFASLTAELGREVAAQLAMALQVLEQYARVEAGPQPSLTGPKPAARGRGRKLARR